MSEIKNLLESATENLFSTTVLSPGEGGEPFAIIPPNYRILELEHLMPHPIRKEGRIVVETLESFVRYLNDFKEKETAIFAQISENKIGFDGIIDYHAPAGIEKPGRKAHVVLYPCPFSNIWKTWNGSNRKGMNQREFAGFLEANQRDLISPPGAAMLELATTLQAKTEVNYASGIRLQNGNVQLVYEETTTTKAGQKGEFQMPEMFTLEMPLFDAGEPFQIDARLRYRLTERKISFWYELDRPDLIVQAAGAGMLAQVEKETGIKPYRGQP